MRLPLAILAAGLIAGPVAADPAPATPAQGHAQRAAPAKLGGAKTICRTNDSMQAVDREPRARARRLDQLPPANLQLAVQREVDGCIEPVIVRYDFRGRGR